MIVLMIARYLLPAERELVERLQDKPFALLGINSDGDREVLNQICEENDITWRNAVDGTTSGPWASSWNVRGWPTLYVLDTEGVIRYKGHDGIAMEAMVEELMAEISE